MEWALAYICWKITLDTSDVHPSIIQDRLCYAAVTKTPLISQWLHTTEVYFLLMPHGKCRLAGNLIILILKGYTLPETSSRGIYQVHNSTEKGMRQITDWFLKHGSNTSHVPWLKHVTCPHLTSFHVLGLGDAWKYLWITWVALKISKNDRVQSL